MKIFKIIILLFIPAEIKNETDFYTYFNLNIYMHFRIGKRKLREVDETRNVVERKGEKAEEIEKNSKRNKARANRRNKVIRYLYNRGNDLDFDLEGLYNVLKG